jgi:hypothetical protein
MRQDRTRAVLARTMTGAALGACLAGCASSGAPPPAAGLGTQAGNLAASQTGEPRVQLVSFRNTPFPYHGDVPDKGEPFLNASAEGRRGHLSPRGGVYFEEQTYNDRRVLVAIPPNFDPRRPAAITVFFHGNNTTLERDVVDRQHLPDQIAASGLNTVLIAPQFAVDAADSSAGGFWRPGAFAAFLEEAGTRLAQMAGDPALARAFHRMPVVLVAYSGGYLPAAYALDVGGAGSRVRGVILLDALYGEGDKFAKWVEESHGRAFFVSAYTRSSREGNDALRQDLARAGIGAENGLPSRLNGDSVVFIDAGDLDHNDFVTSGWVANPVTDVLSRVALPGGSS